MKTEKNFFKSLSAGFHSSISIKTKKRLLSCKRILLEVEKNLKNVKKFTIDYLKRLIDKYGKDYPRKTRIKAIEEIDKRAIETKKIKVGFDPETGFFGTKVSGPVKFDCTNFDKVSSSTKTAPTKSSTSLKNNTSKMPLGSALPIRKPS